MGKVGSPTRLILLSGGEKDPTEKEAISGCGTNISKQISQAYLFDVAWSSVHSNVSRYTLSDKVKTD